MMTKQLLRFLTPRRISLFFILTAILMCSSSWAATYYVDPSGNDTSGNGSSTSPWKSLSTACSKVGSGNTIYINAGSYTDNNRCNLAAGVTIQGAGASSVTIKSAYSGGYGTGYIYRDTSSTSPTINGNNDISGFTLDGSGKTLSTGMWLRGSNNIVIHNVVFQNIKTSAISLMGVMYNPSDYTSSRDNPPKSYATGISLHDLTINDCTIQTTNSSDDRLGAIDIDGVANGSIYNNNINETTAGRGTGIKGVMGGWYSNFKFYNNTIYTDHSNWNGFSFETYNFVNNSEIYGNRFNHLMSLSGGPTTLVPGSTWNLTVHDNDWNQANIAAGSAGNELVHNWVRFYNNYFYNSSVPAAGLWTNGSLTNSGITHWQFDHNVVYNCAAGVFMTRGTNSNISIFNNVFDTMNGAYYGGKYGVWGNGGSASSAAIRNNLMINGTLVSGFSGATVDHNWTAASPGITGSGSRPAPYYLPNGPSSNLLNAGINVGLPFTGTAPAIGAYELGKALSAPTNLVVN